MKDEREEGRKSISSLQEIPTNKYKINYKIPEIAIWQMPQKKSFRQESVIIDITNNDIFLYTKI